jgi:hypothetical protein
MAPSSDPSERDDELVARPAAWLSRIPWLRVRDTATSAAATGAAALGWWLLRLPLQLIPHALRYTGGQLRANIAAPHEREVLCRRGVHGEAAQTYIAWRRSGLVVLGLLVLISAGLHIHALQERLRDLDSVDRAFYTLVDRIRPLDAALAADVELLGVEMLDPLVYGIAGLSLFGLALMLSSVGLVLAALACWSDFRRSRHRMVLAWVTGLIQPLLINVVPLRLLLRWAPIPADGIYLLDRHLPAELVRQRLVAIEPEVGLFAGVLAILAMAPVVLASFPALMRAGLNARRLLPESPVPGWLVIVTPPLYLIATSAFFGFVNQVAGDPKLLLGITAVLIGPMIYVFGGRSLSRPTGLHTAEQAGRSVRWLGSGLALFGYGLIGDYVVQLPLVWEVGLLSTTSVAQLTLESTARYLLTTLVATDLVVHFLLIMLRQRQRYVELEPQLAAEFDHRLEELWTMERPRPPAVAPTLSQTR